MIRTLIRLENLTIFLLSIFLYRESGIGWLPSIILFLLPDLSLGGYLIHRRVGTICYNIAHTYLFAAALMIIGTVTPQSFAFAFPLGLLWIAHIGLDRCLGLGLKYPGSFRETHMQKI